MAETEATRELGVADSVDCPNCGKSLKANALDDGGVAYGPCTSCYSKPTKAEVKEQAEAQMAGVFNRETGTNVEEND